MLPQAVLHKRNGHRQAPGDSELSPAHVLRMIHSAGDPSLSPTYGLLRFASAAQREKASALIGQVASDIDSVRARLADVLARTQGEFEHGLYPDVRAVLESMQAQAEVAMRVVSRLAQLARPAERRPINVAEVILDTLAAVAPRLRSAAVVCVRVAADVPEVLGDAFLLRQMMLILIACAERSVASPSARRTIDVDVSRGPQADGTLGAVVSISGDRGDVLVAGTGDLAVEAAAPAADAVWGADLALATRIVNEHGGTVSIETGPDTPVRVRIELPAL